MCATLNIPDELIRAVQRLSGGKIKDQGNYRSYAGVYEAEKGEKSFWRSEAKFFFFDWEVKEEEELKAQKRREKLLEKRRT